MRPFFLSLLSCLMLAGYSTPKLLWAEESYPDGSLKVRYSYYLDRHGNKVLHGSKLEYSPPPNLANQATAYEYDHGRLIQGPVRTISTPNY